MATPLPSARRGATPGAEAPTGTFCVAALVPARERAPPAPPPAWAVCDNGWAGAASCAAAASRSYAAADAAAHARLADCLEALRPLAWSDDAAAPPQQPCGAALFLTAGGDGRFAGSYADAAAPAVRRAALNFNLSVGDAGYAGVTLLRCARDAAPALCPHAAARSHRGVLTSACLFAALRCSFEGWGASACCARQAAAAQRAAAASTVLVLAALLCAAACAAAGDADAAALVQQAARAAAHVPLLAS